MRERIGYVEMLGYKVSTVSFMGEYETMVFPYGSWMEIYVRRYPSHLRARIGHIRAILWTISYFLKHGAKNVSQS